MYIHAFWLMCGGMHGLKKCASSVQSNKFCCCDVVEIPRDERHLFVPRLPFFIFYFLISRFPLLFFIFFKIYLPNLLFFLLFYYFFWIYYFFPVDARKNWILVGTDSSNSLSYETTLREHQRRHWKRCSSQGQRGAESWGRQGHTAGELLHRPS